MKKRLFSKAISAILACIMTASLFSGAIISASAAGEKVISSSHGSVLSADYGVRLCYTDLETKTLVMTGFDENFVSSADLSVEDEKWINANPYGGYIHMAGEADKPTRTVIKLNGDDGVKLDKGRLIATYKVAAKSPTNKTCLGISDKIIYNGNLEKSFDHSSDCEKIIEASGGWITVTTLIDLPDDISKLSSFEIDFHATCEHYIDDITLWYYPEKAFMINEKGALSMTVASGDSYTFAPSPSIEGWVCNGKVYRSGDTVKLSEIANQTLMALEVIKMIDIEQISLEYIFENDRAGSADGTMKVACGRENLGNANLIELLWGAEGKPLADYTPIKSAEGWEFPLEYTINKDLAIPPEADCLLLAVTDDVNTHYVSFPIPENKLHREGTLLYTAAFISDVHIGWSGLSVRPSQLAAQEEINKFGVDHVLVVGDFVQWYGEHAMAKQWDIAAKYFRGYEMPVYFAKGNHDEPNYKTTYIINKGLENYDTLFSYEYFDQWLDDWFAYSKYKKYYDIERVGEDIDYYSTEIAGHRYVFLAVPNEGYYMVGDEQLKWVEKILFEAEESGKPIFVLCHVPLENKVAHRGGGFDDESDTRLEEIFALHPSVVFVSGDSHYTMDSETQNTVNGGLTSPSYINDGAVVDDVWKAADESDPTSPWSKQPGDLTQGIIAEVYTDRILVRGRYFITGQWISQGLSEVTYNTTCPIEKFEVTKEICEDGSITLTTDHKVTDGLTYSWYLDGELQAETGATITLPADYAGYIAVRATDADGHYRSELYDSLDEISEPVAETETTEAVTTETPTEITTEAPTEITTEKATSNETEDKTEAPDTDKQTEGKTETPTESETDAPTSQGCGAGLAGAGVIATAAAAAAVIAKKKKEEE